MVCLYLGNRTLLWQLISTHSSILAWRIPMDRESRQTAVYGVTESDTTELLSTCCSHIWNQWWQEHQSQKRSCILQAAAVTKRNSLGCLPDGRLP